MKVPVYNSIANHPLFVGSEVARVFTAAPLGYVDIGARRDTPPPAAPIAAVCSFLGFEPDAVECESMNGDQGFKAPWASCSVLPIALGRRTEPRVLHITSLPTNTSLYKPNEIFVDRYNPKGMRLLSTETVPTQPLDAVVSGQDNIAEFVKLDTQGSELDILEGAAAVLARTQCVVAEVEFCEAYEEQPRFSDVERFLRDLGFSFYGFHTLNHRSRKRLNKINESGRERLHWADAAFFRDPFDRTRSGADSKSKRSMQALFLISATLEYYEFALEVADRFSPRERERMSALVHALAHIDTVGVRADVNALAASLERHPDKANLIVGRFVDARRSASDVKDVAEIPD